MFPDAHKLVYGATSRQNGVIPHRNMAGGGSEPGENHMIADLAIVPGMAGNQEKVVIPYPRRAANVRSPVDGGVFPEDVVIPHFQISRLSLVFQILAFQADDGKREKFVAAAEGRRTVDNHMAVQHAAGPQFDMFPDNAKGTDFNIIRDLCSRMHYCRWVYFWHG